MTIELVRVPLPGPTVVPVCHLLHWTAFVLPDAKGKNKEVYLAVRSETTGEITHALSLRHGKRLVLSGPEQLVRVVYGSFSYKDHDDWERVPPAPPATEGLADGGEQGTAKP